MPINVRIKRLDSDRYSYAVELQDGRFINWFTTEELEGNLVHLPQKPKVTQEATDWYEKDYPNDEEKVFDEVLDKFANIAPIDSDVAKWLFQYGCSVSELNKRQHALATLIAYGTEAVEVEKEKKYRVKLNLTNQIIIDLRGDYVFARFHQSYRFKFTKQELEQAGFGCVFDNPMFEVEEVKNDDYS